MGISKHPELYTQSQKLIPAFKCLGDEMRAKIMVVLSDEGELNVNQITERIDLSRPAVSHHLLQLKQAGLVEIRKDGNERFYSIKFFEFLEELQQWIDAFHDQCSHLD